MNMERGSEKHGSEDPPLHEQTKRNGAETWKTRRRNRRRSGARKKKEI